MTQENISDMTQEDISNNTQNKHIETREDTLQFIANTLKNKRLDCSISLRDAEKELNIRMYNLQAMESGDWSAMPEDVYAISFLRQYAKYLKCDINASIEKLKSNDYTLNKPITFPDPPVAPNRKWMYISLVGLIGLFIAFNVIRQQTPSPLPSQMLQKSAQMVTPHQPSSSQPETSKMVATDTSKPLQTNTPSKPASTDHGNIKASAPIPAANTTANTALKATKPSTALVANTTPSASPVTTTTTQVSTQGSANVKHDYIFSARTGDVWLQVYQLGKNKKILREALLKQGQHLSVTSDQPLSITCGKPSALEISMDGKIVVAVGTMTKTKRVVRNFLLPLPAPQ